MRVFRRATNRFPPKSWYDDLDRTIGRGDEDLQFWEKVVKGWVGRGWNPRNVSGMLEYYRRRELPGPDRQRNPQSPSALSDYEAWLAEEGEQ